MTSKGDSAKGESAQEGERAQGESAQRRECQGRECPSPGLRGGKQTTATADNLPCMRMTPLHDVCGNKTLTDVMRTEAEGRAASCAARPAGVRGDATRHFLTKMLRKGRIPGRGMKGCES